MIVLGLRYSLSLYLSIRSRYRLSPATVLDREQQKLYHLAFTTRDRQGVGGTRRLTLEVGDENDSPMTGGTTTIRVYDYRVRRDRRTPVEGMAITKAQGVTAKRLAVKVNVVLLLTSVACS